MTFSVNISNEIMGGLLNVGDVSNEQLYPKKQKKKIRAALKVKLRI